MTNVESAKSAPPRAAALIAVCLTLAADLLDSSESTVASAARRVGYSAPFALGTAFKRTYGVSPAARRAGRSPEAS